MQGTLYRNIKVPGIKHLYLLEDFGMYQIQFIGATCIIDRVIEQEHAFTFLSSSSEPAMVLSSPK